MNAAFKATAVILAIAAVLFAAGCAEETETPKNETPELIETVENITENNTVEDNTAENNTSGVNETMETGQVVTEADNGTNINLKNGENFTLQLRENPSTGYSWQLNLSEGLSILSDEYIQDPAPEEMTGVPGNHSWLIQATAPGSQQVNGIYKRPWENTTGTEDNFTLIVEVV